MSWRVTSSTDEIEKTESDFYDESRERGINSVEWILRLPTDFGADLRQNTSAVSLTPMPILLGSGVERVAFMNGYIIFQGTERSWAALVIRLPMGVLRIIWSGVDLIVEFNYLLTPAGYVRWYTGREFNEMPTATFIDCYGQPTSTLAIRHGDNNYVVRIFPDYPPVVIPQREYLMVQLSLLRDDPALYGRRTQLRRRRPQRALTPRTPSPTPPENRSENDSTVSEYEHRHYGQSPENNSSERRSWRSYE